ncbi:cutinase-domain-containing protein [Fusarium oxysporum]|nr:cutinase-domain-containing protein [Fusarium oxysporum]
MSIYGHSSVSSKTHLNVKKYAARIDELFQNITIELFPQSTTPDPNMADTSRLWQQLFSEFTVNSQEDALNQTRCADITVVFARGTNEGGNVGAVAGPPFLEALREKAASLSVAMQGVEYAANVTGFALGGDPNGSFRICQMSKDQDLNLGVLAGSTIGAQCCKYLPSVILERVSSAVTFGDPLQPSPLKGLEDRSLVICNSGDDICAKGSKVTLPHFAYPGRVYEAADYVLKKAKIY